MTVYLEFCLIHLNAFLARLVSPRRARQLVNALLISLVIGWIVGAGIILL